MNSWITNWKKIRIKVKKIFKKQPVDQQETDWKSCPQCKKISYLPDLIGRPVLWHTQRHRTVRRRSCRAGFSQYFCDHSHGGRAEI